ncbi:MAG: HAD family hydrolase [Verrucomicrobia bacterium]|nr:HAD family hydrolase [Verrucomicrobiota bacterium]
MQTKLLLLDCDSTLSAIEGIDELARLRGEETFLAVESMTRAAMEGGTAMEEIFARRLSLIQPNLQEVHSIGALYIAHIEPTAQTALRRIREAGWTPIIVSGGFTQAILPLAAHLEVERVEAVLLEFDPSGLYQGFSTESPTARSRGKNEVARRLRQEFAPHKMVMVGDGASDLEVRGDVDFVVGFGGYAVREKVKAGADAFIVSLAELPALLEKWS